MDAYYDTYTSPEPIDEFSRDVNVKALIPIFRELLSPSGSDPQDVKEMATFFADMQRQGWACVTSLFGYPHAYALSAQQHRSVI